MFVRTSDSTIGEADPVAIVSDRRTDWGIRLSREAGAPVVLAARELRDFVARLALADMRVSHEAEPGKPLFDLVEEGERSHQGYRISVEPSRVEIRGTPVGILYGVYALLERWGCRFVVPGHDRVPRSPSLSLEPGVTEDAPDTCWRMARLIECPAGEDPATWFKDQVRWCARNRVNWLEVHGGWDGVPPHPGRLPIATDRVLRESGEQAVAHGVKLMIGSHSFFNWCPPGEYFESHPEYFSEIEGVRRPVQLCLTNPEVERVVAERITSFLESHPEAGGVGLGPMDGDEWCGCTSCLAADEPVTMAGGPFHRMRSRSRSLFGFLDRVANRVARRFPDRYLCSFAYVHYSEPPSGFRFTAKNVAINLTWYWNCGNHALDEAGCETAAYYREVQERWLECLAGRGVLMAADYHYGMSAWSLLPWPALRVSARNWAHSIPRGVQPYTFQYYKADPVLYRISDYVWARFVWDVSRAPRWRELLGECCEAHFGAEAGRLVTQYVLEWEDRGEKFSGHLAPSLDKCLLDLIDEDSQGRLEALALSVRSLPASPAQAARVSQFLWQHELFTAAWKALKHRAEAKKSEALDRQDAAREHWTQALASGTRAMSHWPDNRGLIRHMQGVTEEARAALGHDEAPLTSQPDDEVAARMIRAVAR